MNEPSTPNGDREQSAVTGSRSADASVGELHVALPAAPPALDPAAARALLRILIAARARGVWPQADPGSPRG
jgi:hypothetical protein